MKVMKVHRFPMGPGCRPGAVIVGQDRKTRLSAIMTPVKEGCQGLGPAMFKRTVESHGISSRIFVGRCFGFCTVTCGLLMILQNGT